MKISAGSSKFFEGTGLASACINVNSHVDAVECWGKTVNEAEVIRNKIVALLQAAEGNWTIENCNKELRGENAKLKGKVQVSEECCTDMGNKLERVNGLLARKSEQAISNKKQLSKLVIEAKCYKQQLAEAYEILGRTFHQLDKVGLK